MEKQPKKDTWVYVAVENPGGEERFVGYTDSQSDVAYIPAFLSKEEAQACFINLPRDPNKKYEIQAVMFDFLARDAASNGFRVFMLDGEGKIRHKIDPQTVPGVTG